MNEIEKNENIKKENERIEEKMKMAVTKPEAGEEKQERNSNLKKMRTQKDIQECEWKIREEKPEKRLIKKERISIKS